MKTLRIAKAFVGFVPAASVMRMIGSLGLACGMVCTIAVAQTANPPKHAPKPAVAAEKDVTVMDGYQVHQSFDVGGHLVDTSGSVAMYDTLVNVHTGPRILNHTMELHSVPGAKHLLFDTLYEGSAGYGGDPLNYTTVRASKGKLYDFQGMFRRDRQYFDYDLLGNPLIPAGLTSNGYTIPQIQHAPHLFNTVRRMTDLNLTLFPISVISVRMGYSHNISEGPSYSSIHYGTDALLLQNWRNTSDTFMGAIDWKPVRGTTFTYEENIVHYKGDTTWQLAGLDMQLSNGTPVTLGFDNAGGLKPTKATSPCGVQPAVLNSTTTPPTANPCESGFLGYTRSNPIRTLFPTEEFRFQSSSLKNVQMTGRILYTDGSAKQPSYNEYFNGLETRTTLRTSTATGSASGKRINASADFGIVWALNDKVSLSDQYDFQNWRLPMKGTISQVDQLGSSMLVAAGAPDPPAVTSATNFLGQKSHTNTMMAAWRPAGWGLMSLGYRYKVRTIAFFQTDGTQQVQDVNQNAGLFGMVLRPTKDWRINANVEMAWDDASFAPISPRQLQHYTIRTTYKPKSWATLSGAYNDLEQRDNVSLVNYKAHTRSISGGAVLSPSEHYGLDLDYGYSDVYSTSVNCYADTVPPAGATAMPIGVLCGNAVNTATSTIAYYGNSYYDAPTQYGSVGLVLTPVKPIRVSFGYRANAVSGKTEQLHPLNVPGSLQSTYQTPYASLTWKLTHGWGFKGDYNYYGYGENSPVGPTAPRAFHANMVTLAVHYEY